MYSLGMYPLRPYQRLFRVLTAWPFLLALGVLVLNDVVLKYAYPGWLTGKLSDFAGLFVVAGIVLVTQPMRPALLLVLAAVLFAWWKSPQSQGLIDLLQAHGVPWGRVVDPTDLIALVSLPLGVFALRPALRPELQNERSRTRPIAAGVSGAVLLLALMGTSVIPLEKRFSVRKAEVNGQIDAQQTAALIERIASQYKLQRCEECQSAGQGDWTIFRDETVVLQYQWLPNDRGVRFVMWGRPDGLFAWEKGDKRFVGRLHESLTAEFARLFEHMEYVVDMDDERALKQLHTN